MMDSEEFESFLNSSLESNEKDYSFITSALEDVEFRLKSKSGKAKKNNSSNI